MSFNRQLAQVRPSGTTAVSAFSLTQSAPYVIDIINVVNVTTSDVAVSLFHDVDGAVFTEDTALVWKHVLNEGEILSFDSSIYGDTSDETIGVMSSVANAATFTIYGTIKGEQR